MSLLSASYAGLLPVVILCLEQSGGVPYWIAQCRGYVLVLSPRLCTDSREASIFSWEPPRPLGKYSAQESSIRAI